MQSHQSIHDIHWKEIVADKKWNNVDNTSNIKHTTEEWISNNLEKPQCIWDWKEIEITFMRHSKSPYNNYTLATNVGSDLTKYVDYKNQVSDLTDEWIELAKQEASKLVQQYNPKNDFIILISSWEARAYQTAQIVAQALDSAWVSILDWIPSQQKEYPVYLTNADVDKRIIVSKNQSLHYKSMIDSFLFDEDVEELADRIPQNKQRSFNKVRRQIELNNRWSWRKNFKWRGEIVESDVWEELPTLADNKWILQDWLETLTKIMHDSRTVTFFNNIGKKPRIIVVTHEEKIHPVGEYLWKPLETIKNCDTLTMQLYKK